MRIKVRIRNVEQSIPEHELALYLKNGWQRVEETKPVVPTVYDKYTDKQLVTIGKNKNMVFEKKSREEKIELLTQYDIKSGAERPKANGKFTDNLFLED